MDIERFFAEHNSSPSRAFSASANHRHSALPEEVRQVANLGLRIFPISLLAKLTGNPDLLIAEATSEIYRLGEMAVMYAPCDWRVVVDPAYCFLRIDGQVGRNTVAALSQDDQVASLTLQAYRGDTVWAYFRRSKGLVMLASARQLAPGLSILADDDSCPIPPSGGCAFVNPLAEIEAVPFWLRELAFESADNPPGKAAPVPASSPLPSRCRLAARFVKPQRDTRKRYPICDQAGWRGGFRISRRR